mgnify:CR=1 FL=1
MEASHRGIPVPNRVDKSQSVPEIFDPKVSYKRGRRLATVRGNGIRYLGGPALIAPDVLANFWTEIPPASAPFSGVPIVQFLTYIKTVDYQRSSVARIELLHTWRDRSRWGADKA